MDAKQLYLEGTVLFKQKKYHEALEYYEASIKKDKNYPQPYNGKGNVLNSLRRYEEAIPYFDKALEIDPHYRSPWNGKGISLDNLGAKEEALKFFDQALSIDPAYSLPLLNKGFLYIGQEKYSLAIGCFEKAIELDSQLVDAYVGKGRCYAEMKKFEESILLFDKAMYIDSNHLGAIVGKIASLNFLKRYSTALEIVKLASEIEPENFYLLIHGGDTYYYLNEDERARLSYQKATELYPDYSQGWFKISNLDFKEKAYEESHRNLKRAIKLSEKDPALWHNLGNSLLELKNYDLAISAYERADELGQKKDLVLAGMGNVYLKQKRFGEASEAYRKAIEIEPSNAPNWYGLGNVFFKKNDFQKAVTNFLKALELDDGFADAWHALGASYYHLAKFENAIKCLDRASKLDGSKASTWNTLGAIKFDMEEYALSLEYFNAAINLDPEVSIYWNSKGNNLYKLSELDEALFCLDKAIELDDQYPVPWNGKGAIYYERRDYTEALNCYNKAISIDQTYGIPWIGRGNTLLKVGNVRAARISYLKAYSLGQVSLNIFHVLFNVNLENPFFSYDFVLDYVGLNHYYSWSNVIKETIQKSQHFKTYIGYLQLSQKHKKLKNWEWNNWLGIINFYMGHPFEAFERLKRVINVKRTDMCSFYYLILACRDFACQEIEYTSKAEAVIVTLLKDIVPRDVKSSYEIKQVYYGGQFLTLYDRKEEALSLFSSIQDSFLPALYMSLLMEKEITGKIDKEKANEIHAKEKELVSSEGGFALGIESKVIDIGTENFNQQFTKNFTYYEIEEAIDIFHSWSKKKVFSRLKVLPPEKTKDIWDIWKLSSDQYKNIFQVAREKRLKELTKKIVHSRIDKLRKEKGGSIIADNTAENKILEYESEKLSDAYERLKKIKDNIIVEKRLAGMINDWILPKSDLYVMLTSILVLSDKLNEDQKVYLDFYCKIKEYSQKKPNDLIFAGLKDEFKELISHSFNILTSIIGITGSFFDLFLKPFIKGTLSELIIRFLKQEKTKFHSYKEFKDGLSLFIGQEKERLGVDFDFHYPLYNLEVWRE